MIMDMLTKITTNIKNTIIIVLIGFLAIQGWLWYQKNRKVQELQTYIEGLPDGTKQIVTIEKNVIKTVFKDREGKTIYKEKYIPSEGNVRVITKDDNSVEIHAKTLGFTYRPGLAMVSDFKDVQVAVDMKLGYWGRYSTGVGSSREYAYIFASRHIDDITYKLRLQNVEVFGGYGRRYSNFSEGTVVAGIRINF